MKLIIGLVLGFLIGYQLGRRAFDGSQATGEAAARRRKLIGSATRMGLGAVQKARTSVQGRLSGNGSEA